MMAITASKYSEARMHSRFAICAPSYSYLTNQKKGRKFRLPALFRFLLVFKEYLR